MNPLPFLLAAESFLFLVGFTGMRLLGTPFVARPDPLRDTLAFFALYVAFKGLDKLFARLAPEAYRATDRLMRQVARRIPDSGVLLLAAASALAEEVFFRGFLIGLFSRWLPPAAVLLSALVFMLFHPVPDRRAYLYTVYVGVAGLLFGASYLATESLIPGILAHFLVNAEGLWEARRGTSVPPGSVS